MTSFKQKPSQDSKRDRRSPEVCWQRARLFGWTKQTSQSLWGRKKTEMKIGHWAEHRMDLEETAKIT